MNTSTHFDKYLFRGIPVTLLISSWKVSLLSGFRVQKIVGPNPSTFESLRFCFFWDPTDSHSLCAIILSIILIKDSINWQVDILFSGSLGEYVFGLS